MRLAQKVAIVTGAGSGFGEGIAERFAREGARVVVNDIHADNGERVAEAIRRAGGQACFVKADVSDGEEVKALLDSTLAAFGSLDIVVNNAGISHRNQSMLTVAEDEFDRVYRVNVKSLFWAAVNVINPVAGETPLLATFMGEDTPEMRAKFIGSIPLGRLSQPADIANAALFLASEEAAFITGACLEVDGGRCV